MIDAMLQQWRKCHRWRHGGQIQDAVQAAIDTDMEAINTQVSTYSSGIFF